MDLGGIHAVLQDLMVDLGLQSSILPNWMAFLSRVGSKGFVRN